MNSASTQAGRSVFAQLRPFLALSRTPHGIIDMATPALAAILWLGSFPSLPVVCLGIITAFAGYTTVYALNDLVDYRTDRERFERELSPGNSHDLDSVFLRHPMASGALSGASALLWTLGWASLTLIGAFLLNPLCVAIFLAACLLEAIYCLAWRTSWMKVFVSGAVKASGPLAAVYAVDPNPSQLFLVLLFFWLFFWEIGGQNIPNDWADIEEDLTLQASTVPVRFGTAFTARFILILVFLTLCMGGMVITSSQTGNSFAHLAASIASGIYLLLLPALRLYVKRDKAAALALFNKASYYPAVLLAVAIPGAIGY